jgi:hypothetical protein
MATPEELKTLEKKHEADIPGKAGPGRDSRFQVRDPTSDKRQAL